MLWPKLLILYDDNAQLGYIPNFANGFLFDEKVPFDLISIKNEGFGFLLDDDYLK